jgi:uncharacterized membrane-anchored protein
MGNMPSKLIRVPQISFIFWLIKIISTTIGETGADFLAFDLKFGMPIVTLIMTCILGFVLYLQFAKNKNYMPIIYWSIVILMSIIGTLVTDILVDELNFSLVLLSVIFSILMAIGFWGWHRSEGTLSIHSIDSQKRETLYWLMILLTFALGTAIGDLISEHWELGYRNSILLFGGIISITAVCRYRKYIGSVSAFWIAFVMTRPLGASIGDFLAKPASEGGLGVDAMVLNSLFCLTILVLVGYLQFRDGNDPIQSRE